MVQERVSILIEDRINAAIAGKLKQISTQAREAHLRIQQLRRELGNVRGTSAFGTLSREVRALDTNVSRLSRSQLRMNRAVNQGTAGATRYNSVVRRSARDTRLLGNGVRGAARNIRDFASFGAIFATGAGIVSAVDGYTDLQNRLRLVSDGQAHLNTLTEEMFDLSRRTRTEVGDTSETFAQLDRSLQAMGVSQTRSIRLFETLTKAFRLTGSSGQEVTQSLRQLNQAIRSGRLQGDELRTVREAFPNEVLEQFARNLGTTVGGLKALSTELGGLPIEPLLTAIEEVGPSIDEQFGNLRVTFSDVFTSLRNTATRTLGELTKTNFVQGITDGLNEMSQSATVSFGAIGAGIGLLLGGPLGALVGAITGIILAWDEWSGKISVSSDNLVSLRAVGEGTFGVLTTRISESIKQLDDFVGRLVTGEQAVSGIGAVFSRIDTFIQNTLATLSGLTGALSALIPVDLGDRVAGFFALWKDRINDVIRDLNRLIANPFFERFLGAGAGAGIPLFEVDPRALADGRRFAEQAANGDTDKLIADNIREGFAAGVADVDKLFNTIDEESRKSQIGMNIAQNFGEGMADARNKSLEELQVIERKALDTANKIRNMLQESDPSLSGDQLDSRLQSTIRGLQLRQGLENRAAGSGGAAEQEDARLTALIAKASQYQNALSLATQNIANSPSQREFDILTRVIAKAQDYVRRLTLVQAVRGGDANTPAGAELTRMRRLLQVAEQYRRSLQDRFGAAGNAGSGGAGGGTPGAAFQQSQQVNNAISQNQSFFNSAQFAAQDYFSTIAQGFSQSSQAAGNFNTQVQNQSAQFAQSQGQASQSLQQGYTQAFQTIGQSIGGAFEEGGFKWRKFLGGLLQGGLQLFASRQGAFFNQIFSGAPSQGRPTFNRGGGLFGSFMTGGFTGTGASTDEAGVVHRNEFVLRERATRRIPRPALEYMNQTGRIPVADGGGSNMNVSVSHDGSTGIAVEQISGDEVRIIAKQEAATALRKGVPRAVAGDIGRSNSRISRSLRLNTDSRRRR